MATEITLQTRAGCRIAVAHMILKALKWGRDANAVCMEKSIKSIAKISVYTKEV
jgi:hypothetical protein